MRQKMYFCMYLFQKQFVGRVSGGNQYVIPKYLCFRRRIETNRFQEKHLRIYGLDTWRLPRHCSTIGVWLKFESVGS